MKSEPIVRGLRDQLINHLRNDVLTGHYEEGEAIRQDEVVARYNVSRTPVREALIQLAQEGLVTNTPNCGARVAQHAPDSIHELFIPIRRIIEVYALRLCFENLNEQDFKIWDTILEKMRLACERRDFPAVAEQDIAFHRYLIERAGEPALERIWSTIVGQVRAHFRRSHSQYEDLMDVFREHAAIIATFRSGGQDAAIDYLAHRIGDADTDVIFEDLLISRDSKSPKRVR
ncbi:MAG: GntR family transcriptional regulator [Aeoliella sp.]